MIPFRQQGRKSGTHHPEGATLLILIHFLHEDQKSWRIGSLYFSGVHPGNVHLRYTWYNVHVIDASNYGCKIKNRVTLHKLNPKTHAGFYTEAHCMAFCLVDNRLRLQKFPSPVRRLESTSHRHWPS